MPQAGAACGPIDETTNTHAQVPAAAPISFAVGYRSRSNEGNKVVCVEQHACFRSAIVCVGASFMALGLSNNQAIQTALAAVGNHLFAGHRNCGHARHHCGSGSASAGARHAVAQARPPFRCCFGAQQDAQPPSAVATANATVGRDAASSIGGQPQPAALLSDRLDIIKVVANGVFTALVPHGGAKVNLKKPEV